MHACARALHDAVKASTPVERNFLQLGPGPFLGWGRRFCPWYCYRKTKKTKQKKTKKKYCTVEIPTEMEFTGTFQKYLQCVNRMWFSNIRSVCLSRLTDYSIPDTIHTCTLPYVCYDSVIMLDEWSTAWNRWVGFLSRPFGSASFGSATEFLILILHRARGDDAEALAKNTAV